MEFNWGLIGKAPEYGRRYEIVQAVKDYVPMDQIDPPLNEAEKEYYRVTEYMLIQTVGENGDRHSIVFDFTVNDG